MTLSVAPGTVFGLIGPNGAGKTTTLRMLVDIIRPTSGTARVLGSDPRTGGAALRRRIGYVPGELRMEGRSTGRRLPDFYASVSGPVRNGHVNELAERLSCDLSRPVRTLSKGNKQKLGLIQAFMHEPPLLILDEPTSGLDPLVQREFLGLVHEAREKGQTVLGRVPYTLESALAILVKLMALGVVIGVTVGILNGPSELGLEASGIIAATLALTGLGAVSAAAALLAGAASGRRVAGVAAGAGVAVYGYALQALANQSDDLSWVERLSPYSWAYAHTPLESGLGWGIAAVWGAAMLLTGAAALTLRARDVSG